MAYGLKHNLAELIEANKNPTLIDPTITTELSLLRRGIKLRQNMITLPEGSIESALVMHIPGVTETNDNLEKLTPEKYFQLVQDLVCKGVAYQKKAGIYGHNLFPLNILTQNSGEGLETKNEVQLGRVMIFDGAHYNQGEAKDLVRFIFNEYGQSLSYTDSIAPDFLKAINNGTLELSCDVKGYGIWTMTPKNFKNDYEDIKGNGFFTVKPGTTRFCMDVDHGFEMPVKWGVFTERKGGTIAARTEELPAIIEAINDIKAGRKTILEALYEIKDGVVKARFDIYGMDPNFRQDNYDPKAQPLPPETKKVLEAFRSTAG